MFPLAAVVETWESRSKPHLALVSFFALIQVALSSFSPRESNNNLIDQIKRHKYIVLVTSSSIQEK